MVRGPEIRLLHGEKVGPPPEPVLYGVEETSTNDAASETFITATTKPCPMQTIQPAISWLSVPPYLALQLQLSSLPKLTTGEKKKAAGPVRSADARM
jgi:hypothetical protein